MRHKPKKSDMLSRSEIDKFIVEIPDDMHLLMKIVVAFGIFGVCRHHELHNLCIGDVKAEGHILVIYIYSMELYEKYVASRPKNVKCKNLFLYYRGGRCSYQPVDINTFGKFPMEIAKLGGWKSGSVAESYIEELIESKIEIAKQITVGSRNVTAVDVICGSGITFSNMTNCTFNIYQGK